jgi:hypothetical protein
MDAGRTQIMLDPSLLLDRPTFERTYAALARIQTDGALQLFVSSSLDALYTAGEGFPAAAGFFAAEADLVEPAEIQDRLAGQGIAVFERPPGAEREYESFYRALGEAVNQQVLQDILFDEWFFLTHESWLLSRIKAPFQAMVKAGEMGIELLNPIVRQTLKEDSSYVLSTVDRLRALAKWIAVGGPTVAALLNPIAGALASGVAEGFLLIDPPARD